MLLSVLSWLHAELFVFAVCISFKIERILDQTETRRLPPSCLVAHTTVQRHHMTGKSHCANSAKVGLINRSIISGEVGEDEIEVRELENVREICP
ncbi:hypothetical protein BDZ45DRAFT_426983 [Acephala macrosclerotiorum]|nr:hypothetical protein BDZ45DRAFT_426983 [Acephala macrosclerotiorum]